MAVQYDAFGNPINLTDPLEQKTTYNIYENRPFASGQGANLQNVYGTKAMPMFEFIRQIKVGERTYDPSRPEDKMYYDMYENYRGLEPEAPSWEEAIGISVAPQVGAGIVQGIVNPGNYYGGNTFDRAVEGVKDAFSRSPQQKVTSRIAAFDPEQYVLGKDQVFVPELADPNVAKATGNLELYKDLRPAQQKLESETKNIFGNTESQNVYSAGKLAEQGYGFDPQGKLVDMFAEEPTALYDVIDTGISPTIIDPRGSTFDLSPQDYRAVTSSSALTSASEVAPGFQGYADRVANEINPFSAAGKSNFAGAGGASIASAAVTLLATGDVEKAAKTGIGTFAGKVLGTALLGPVGGVVGGMIGGALGGRVICNELNKQGLITRKELINDYKFTRDYLSTKHVNGYHMWALWMVKQMRQGKYVKFWTHVVKHRANEIAYIYGERKKPDYLGKLYRKIFEPVCWTLGLFCKETDWSVLYKTKEI